MQGLVDALLGAGDGDNIRDVAHSRNINLGAGVALQVLKFLTLLSQQEFVVFLYYKQWKYY